MNNAVRALTVFDDGGGPALYAGGYFSTAGGVNANHLARWDGTSWSALGTGVNNGVAVLTVFEDTLYAGGGFAVAGGKVSARLAKWTCVRQGDMNQDSMVDLGDFQMFFYCLGGPSQVVDETAWACEPADIDSDHNIDLTDFATLQRAFGQ